MHVVSVVINKIIYGTCYISLQFDHNLLGGSGTWNLNSMSHWDSHNDSLSRSFCSTVPSSKPPIVRYTAVSSAKSRTCDDNFSGRSFMKTRSRIGPKTEP